jgi:hypothetical protein
MQAGACTNSRTSAIFGSDSRREHFCLTRAPFSFCRLNCPIPQHIQSVKSHVAIGALAHFVGEYAFTPVVRRRLSELARTGNVATTDVEPIATHPPMGNVCHRCAPFAKAVTVSFLLNRWHVGRGRPATTNAPVDHYSPVCAITFAFEVPLRHLFVGLIRSSAIRSQSFSGPLQSAPGGADRERKNCFGHKRPLPAANESLRTDTR